MYIYIYETPMSEGCQGRIPRAMGSACAEAPCQVASLKPWRWGWRWTTHV